MSHPGAVAAAQVLSAVLEMVIFSDELLSNCRDMPYLKETVSLGLS